MAAMEVDGLQSGRRKRGRSAGPYPVQQCGRLPVEHSEQSEMGQRRRIRGYRGRLGMAGAPDQVVPTEVQGAYLDTLRRDGIEHSRRRAAQALPGVSFEAAVDGDS